MRIQWSCERKSENTPCNTPADPGRHMYYYTYTHPDTGISNLVRVVDIQEKNPQNPHISLKGHGLIYLRNINDYVDPGFTCTTSTGANCNADTVVMDGGTFRPLADRTECQTDACFQWKRYRYLDPVTGHYIWAQRGIAVKPSPLWINLS